MRLPLLASCLLFTLTGQPALAAESYDNCTGFVDALPATLTTQGTWCLRGDLSTAIGSGSAITVATNNVTLDCNGFKLGGLAAGPGTQAYGVRATARANLTVRNCNIRGFVGGVFVIEGVGVTIEDNLFDGNYYIGVSVEASGSVIQRNTVNDTGGSTVVTTASYGIVAAAGTDVVDNSISGLTVDSPDGGTVGIFTASNSGAVVSGNRVRGMGAVGSGSNFGIQDAGSLRIVYLENILQDDSGHEGVGISCTQPGGVARNNTINGFEISFTDCISSGNVFN